MFRILILAVAILLPYFSFAVVYEFWDYDGDGSWANQNNWDADGVQGTGPGTSIGSSDEVYIWENVDYDEASQLTVSGDLIGEGGNITNSTNQNLRLNSGGSISFNSSSTVTFGGRLLFLGGTINIPNGSSMNFTSSSSHSLRGALTLNGNLTIGGSGSSNSNFSANIGSTGSFDVNGGLTNAGTITNTGDIFVAGNFSNNGTFTSTNSSSTVSLDGSSLQTVSGLTAYNITVNNNSNISLTGNMTVAAGGTLTITDGNINTSTNKVILGTGSSISGESSSQYVIGELEATESVVTSSTYTFGGSGVSVAVSGGSTNAGTVTMNRFTGTNTAGNSNSGLARYVTFDATASNYTSATVTMNYYDSELSGDITDESQMQAFRTASSSNETDGTASWSGVSESVNATSNLITISGLEPAQFDEFSFSGGGHEQVLPIVLANFEVSLENDLINLDWTTAIEENNEGFELQRSYDGLTFEPAGWVDGNGNSLSPIDYSFIDREANMGKSKTIYYRIRQVDFDGVFNYTPTRSINLDGSSTITWFPNPAQENIVVNTNETATVEVYDMAGKTVLTTNTLESNSIDVSRIEMGTYLMIIKNMNGEVISQDKLHIK
jgi:hypothetical protein